jgi:DNA-binding LytR/AlgR family response regulator
MEVRWRRIASVAKASNGKEAIAMLEADGEYFRALVSDINLGTGPTGRDVTKRSRELNPHLPIVYITGGSAHEWASPGVPNSLIVTKPFTPAKIVTAVWRLLGISEP